MQTKVLIEESQRGRAAKRIASVHRSQEDAVETAKAIVESGLLELWHRGMSAQTLMKHWSARGENVYVLPEDEQAPPEESCFSAQDYARISATQLAVHGRL